MRKKNYIITILLFVGLNLNTQARIILIRSNNQTVQFSTKTGIRAYPKILLPVSNGCDSNLGKSESTNIHIYCEQRDCWFGGMKCLEKSCKKAGNKLPTDRCSISVNCTLPCTDSPGN